MRWPRPQISLRGILLAIFWVAIALAIDAAHVRYARVQSKMPFEIPLTWVMMIAPFVAVGTLFGRTLIGAAVGLIAITGFWLVWSMT
jgi:hypothetical protein